MSGKTSSHARRRPTSSLISTPFTAATSSRLVTAAFNSGEGAVVRRLQTLPDDPQVRNFWTFYNNQCVPHETQDFVMWVETNGAKLQAAQR